MGSATPTGKRPGRRSPVPEPDPAGVAAITAKLVQDKVLRPRVDMEGDGDLARVVDDLEAALIEHEAPIYQRAGELVRVIDGESPRRGMQRDPAAPLIVRFTDVSLQVEITRHVETWKRNQKTREMRAIDCPLAVARALRERREWRFPELAGVVGHPIVLPDGSVLWENGYHAKTGLLFHAAPYSWQAPINAPTMKDAQTSLAALRGLLQEFPFVEGVDESVALAFLLTMFVRPVLQAAPAFAINATSAGTGKSYLVRLASVLPAGREPALMTIADDPAELKKVLFAALLQGEEHIAIDNVSGAVDSPALCALLTSPRYQDRVLGASEMVGLPTSAVVSMNGNNLMIVGDLTRRVLECRLDAECERPGERRFDADPIALVRERASEFVLSAVTVLQAYAVAGHRVDCTPFGSFEDWSRMVREALIWLGMDDPCKSQRHLEDEDPERAALRAMLVNVGRAFGEVEFLGGDLVQAVGTRSQAEIAPGRVIDAEHREGLRAALRTVCERNGELSPKALGRWLRKVRGRVVGGAKFIQCRESAAGLIWKAQQGF